MKNRRPYTLAHALVTCVTFFILLGNVALVYGVDAFGSPFLFAGALIAELFFLIIFIYSLLRALQVPLSILVSIGISAWQGISCNVYIKRLRRTKSSSLRWIGSRLNPQRPTGLLLSTGILTAVMFLAWFGSILHDVLAHGPLTQTDIRVLNLMPEVRTPLQTDFFRFVTFAVNTQSVTLVVILMVIIFWLYKQRIAASLVIALTLVNEICAFSIKHLVGRTRPARSLRLLPTNDFSFPSGHALTATLLFGMLAYFIYRSVKTPLARLAIVLGYITAVGLVTLSRVYLGVHYPTDVIGGILLGASLLTLLITGIEVTTRTNLWHIQTGTFENRLLLAIMPVLILFSLIFSSFFLHTSTAPQQPRYVTLSALNVQTVTQLPKTSETLTGKTAEPVDFIYIGSQAQITHLFLAHGWHAADSSTLAHTLQAFSVGFQGRQYATAPVTPFYVDARPEALAFEQPTLANTLRQRHHTRIWRTGYELQNGKNVWVATASFDERIEFTGITKLPTHHTSPDLDAERSYIIHSLGISQVSYISLNRAQAGKNAGGDLFFTDGKAVVLTL